MPDDQEVPKGLSDWSLDALVIGDGTVIERPSFSTKGSTVEYLRHRNDGASDKESK